MNNILNRVQTILNLDSSKEQQLNELVNIQYQALSNLLNVEKIPTKMEYIVVETSIARYNRLGSEGLESENIDVISQTFVDDLFKPYQSQIKAFLDSTPSSNSKKVRLL